MNGIIKATGITATFFLGSMAALGGAVTSQKSDSGSIVIIFKDGHKQSISLADIARMDFSAASAESPAAAAKPLGPLPSKNRFIGKWKLGDGTGNSFIVKLRDNGEATKSFGAAHGTWTYVNGEAHIAWDDGWHDAIRKSGTRYEKFAYAPGKSFADQPDNVTEAGPVTPEPI